MALTGATLSKIVWAISPFYTGALVYLLPLIMAARGRRFRDALVVSWIFVICIFFLECYLLPLFMLRLGGAQSEKIEIPDTMPGMATVILFGWMPGLLMAAIGRGFRQWKERSRTKQST